jgi:glycosyltransferase involved in cell wall biosynthesis
MNSLGNPGGMERVLCTKVNFLVEHFGFKISLLVKLKLPNDLFFKFSKEIEIHSFGLSNQNLFNRILLNKKEYHKKLEEYLHISKNDFVIGLFGSELPFLYKIKDGSIKIQEFHFSRNYLVHLVNNLPSVKYRYLKKLRAKYIQYRERSYAKNYDALVLLTKKDQELWGPLYNSYVIPNPLSFHSKEKSTLKNRKIIAVGRLIAQKGFEDLILAFSRIHQCIEGWSIDIYGEGQDYNYLNSLIAHYKMQDKIKINKAVKNIQAVFIDSALFVFPSKYEGFGLVLTEAMECGLPTIAYDCECGPSEIIMNGEDGYLVSDFDIDTLSLRIKELALNNERRLEFSSKAIENVKRFNADKIMKEWKLLFEFFNQKQK